MTLAYEPPGEPVAEPFYDALLTALSESARGREFLAEYARRKRAANTDMLLAALSRLEAHIVREGTAAERLRDDLRMLLIAIRLARPEIETADPPARAEKLGKLIDLLHSRVAAIAGETSGEALPPAPPSDAAEVAPAAARIAQPIIDPLAPLTALSEDERLALFT